MFYMNEQIVVVVFEVLRHRRVSETARLIIAKGPGSSHYHTKALPITASKIASLSKLVRAGYVKCRDRLFPPVMF